MTPRRGELSDSRYYHDGHLDRDWVIHAACRGRDTEMWFPTPHADRQSRAIAKRHTEIALQTCFECPVWDECLRYAIAADARYGIWGGATEYERFKLTGRRVG